jgi:FkbM family methyltransferase
MRKHVREVRSVCGCQTLNANVFTRYFASFLGNNPIQFIKNLGQWSQRAMIFFKKLNPMTTGLLSLRMALRSLYHLGLRVVGGHGWRRYRIIQWLSSWIQQGFVSSRTTMVDGHIMVVDEKDSLHLRLNGVYEEEETAFISRTIQPGQQIIDIGANIGYYTLKFCRLTGPAGRVFAFEPDPVNYGLLQQNVQQNHYTQVGLYQQGVGETAGKVNLYKDKENHGDHRRFNSDHREEVVVMEIVRLDDLPFIRYNPIHFIKMDIQGGEYYALLGMQKLLSENKSVQVLTEFWPYALREMQIAPVTYLDLWRELGFNFYILLPGKKGHFEPITQADLLGLIPEDGRGHANIILKRS